LAGAMWLRPLQLAPRVEGAIRRLFAGVARALLFIAAPVTASPAAPDSNQRTPSSQAAIAQADLVRGKLGGKGTVPGYSGCWAIEPP